MKKIGLFYASSTGNTENMATEIKESLSGLNITMHDIAQSANDEMTKYDALIIGSSTWGDGDLQDDWEDYIVNLDDAQLSGKTVALFGLGDQEEYPDHFLSAMGTIYEKVVSLGANVVGSFPTDGFEFDESTAVVDGKFVGLALDEDNQDDQSQTRIKSWCDSIRPHFA
ncbi:MAG: flavodoxin [Sulfurimonas sp.]|jgi:flavodoxin I|nr:flavodoxin [Sulfurimonas sp.]